MDFCNYEAMDVRSRLEQQIWVCFPFLKSKDELGLPKT